MLLALQLNSLLADSAPIPLGSIPDFSAPFNSGTHNFEIGDYVAGADSYAISPAVEAGWSFNTTTGRLTIDTDAEATFGPYTVTATNGHGDTILDSFTVRVSAWDGVSFYGGTAYSDSGVMGASFLDDATAVPAVSYMHHGFAHDLDGRRYVALWPASNAVNYWAGLARRQDGAMIIATSGAAISHIQGLVLTFRGEVVAAVDTPIHTHNGWPLTAAGILCISEVS